MNTESELGIQPTCCINSFLHFASSLLCRFFRRVCFFISAFLFFSLSSHFAHFFMLCTDEESLLMSDCDGVTKVAVEELGDVTSGADDSPT